MKLYRLLTLLLIMACITAGTVFAGLNVISHEQIEERLQRFCTDDKLKRRRMETYCGKIITREPGAYCNYIKNEGRFPSAYNKFCDDTKQAQARHPEKMDSEKQEKTAEISPSPEPAQKPVAGKLRLIKKEPKKARKNAVAVLIIDSDPGGADVFLEGQKTGSTPYQNLNLTAGQALSIVLKKPDYHSKELKLTLKGGINKPQPVKLIPQFGTLKITSEPSGAEVLISGKPAGKTPYANPKQRSGKYLLTLRYPFYKPVTNQQITVNDGELTEQHFALKPHFGRLKIDTNPAGVNVTIRDANGKRVQSQVSPVNIKLSPDSYAMTLSKEGYEPLEYSFTLPVGESIVLEKTNATLRKQTGRLIISSTPYTEGARVLIDGKLQGEVPADLTLPVGTYQVKVVAGLENNPEMTGSQQLTVKRNETTSVAIPLSRKENKEICFSGKQARPELDTETGVVLATWIVSNQARILSCPEGGSPVNFKFRFGDKYFLADEEARTVNGKAWRLILEIVGDKSLGDKYQAIGWIEKENLLSDQFPLMDPSTSISYKALITNEGKGGGQQVIPVYLNPYRKGEPSHKLSVRSLTYIFRMFPYEAEMQVAEKIPNITRSVLIGYQPALNAFNEHAGPGLLGWISPRYLTLWNTREALTLRGKVPIYQTKQDAINHNHSAIIAISSGKPVRYDAMRNPILKEDLVSGMTKIAFWGGLDAANVVFISSTYRNIVEKIKQGKNRENQNGQPLLYEEGWVNPKTSRGKESPFDKTILVQQNDIVRLSALLYDLSSVTPSPREIKRVWGKVIEEYTGDVCNPDEKIQMCMDQAGAFSLRGGMLNYSLDELIRMAQTNMRRFRTIQCEMKKANKRVRAFIEEKIYEFAIINSSEGQCKIKSKHLSDQKRWFKPESESILAWIDLKDMP